MFLYARLGKTTILGLPACVYYHPTTVFDLMLPRMLAGDTITKKEVAEMGHGGLCMNCERCRFPVCTFGHSRDRSTDAIKETTAALSSAPRRLEFTPDNLSPISISRKQNPGFAVESPVFDIYGKRGLFQPDAIK